MTKALKKICLIYLSIIVILATFSRVFATDVATNLNVIQETSETLYLENDQGFISKKIVNSNKDTGEVTIELKLSNTKKDAVDFNNTEIVLVIDNSISMDFKTKEGKTRKSIILNSAINLVNNIFDTSTNVKIGIVKFRGDLATVITKPTSEKDKVISGLDVVQNKDTESGTNIQKGLKSAEGCFSNEAKNKVIILLTDGCPNNDAYGNGVSDVDMIMSNENYLTILENTKNELLHIENEGMKLISLMVGLNSDDIDHRTGKPLENNENDKLAVEMVFGSETSPTAGEFYNAKTTDADKVISEGIENDVKHILSSPLSNVKIVDYFPEDIADNFEFSYVGNASIGDVTEDIDPGDHTIEWNIDTLKGDEVATVQYKLKIKDMNNAELLNKTIATNEKVVLTYKDTDSKDYTVTLNSSPKIQLSEIKQEENDTQGENNSGIITSNNEKDGTQASGKLPQTGIGVGIVVVIISIIGIGIFSYSKIREYKDI